MSNELHLLSLLFSKKIIRDTGLSARLCVVAEAVSGLLVGFDKPPA